MCINKIPFLQVVEELKLEIKPLRLFRLASHSTHNDAISFVKLEKSQVKKSSSAGSYPCILGELLDNTASIG